MRPPLDLRCYAILDPTAVSGRNPVELAQAAAAGGATLVQLRDKSPDTRARIDLARAVVKALEPAGVPLLINDSVEVALVSGAAGAHVGRSDMPPAEARALLGPEAILGLTVHHPDEARALDPNIVDYAGIGPIFTTRSKDPGDPPMGPEGLAALKALLPRTPVCGIAGITHENAPSVIEAGAAGVAVIADIFGAEDVEDAARRLRSVVDRALDGLKAPRALTIAGSDSGGGAGIQADLKAFSALGAYGASVITALTAQNTKSVTGIFDVDPAFVEQQIDTVMDDIGADAVKIGMLGRPEVIRAVAGRLAHWRPGWIVLDPVMVAKSGDKLLGDDAVEALHAELLPKASLLTPNLPEAAVLLDERPAHDRGSMQLAAERLLAMGPGAVLLKGGHLSGTNSPDLLLTGERAIWLEAPRHATHNTHGTGCTLSSAVAAGLARGMGLVDAVVAAKAYVSAAILAADRLSIGKGNGPVHHFHAFWPVSALAHRETTHDDGARS